MNIGSPSEKTEFKEAISCISHFPPLRAVVHHIAKFPPFNKENSEISLRVNIIQLERILWYWVGKSLNAFFNDESDPLSEPETIEEIIRQLARIHNDLPLEDLNKKIKALKIDSAKYRIYTNLIFEGEKFIKSDLEKIGISINFKRSELLKIIAFEECAWRIMQWLYDWEALSKRQSFDRLRKWKQYKTGQISEETILHQAKVWDEEDQKLFNTLPPFEEVCFWTCFCLCSFEKYSKDLPSYASLQAFEEPPSGDDFRMEYQKFGIFGGEYQKHSRGTKSRHKPTSL
jgi:hypothetical protein